MRRVTAGLGLLVVMFMFLFVLELLPVHAASSLVQQNDNSGEFFNPPTSSPVVTVALSSVASGDVLVVGLAWEGTFTSLSDTLSSSFSLAVTKTGGVNGNAAIYTATLSSSGADTVTAKFTNPSGAFDAVFVYEVAGVTTTGAATGTGGGCGTSPYCGAGTSVFTSSVSFPTGAFLLGMIANGCNCTVTAGAGFTLSPQPLEPTSNAEFSNSVSPSTTFPATLSSMSFGWVEAGIALDPAPTSAQVATATGTGTATFTMSPSTAGGFTSLTASAVSSISTPPPVGLTFPDGLFSFTISGLAAGATVTVTITLPRPLPAGSFSYWKFQSGTWTQFPSASLDSTRTIITLTFTASASGTVTDPGGPTITPTIIPEYPLGLPLLAIFMVIGYGFVRRRIRNDHI